MPCLEKGAALHAVECRDAEAPKQQRLRNSLVPPDPRPRPAAAAAAGAPVPLPAQPDPTLAFVFTFCAKGSNSEKIPQL